MLVNSTEFYIDHRLKQGPQNFKTTVSTFLIRWADECFGGSVYTPSGPR